MTLRYATPLLCASALLAVGLLAQEGGVVTPAAFKSGLVQYRPITGNDKGLPDMDTLASHYLESGYGGVMFAPTSPPSAPKGGGGVNMFSLGVSLGLPLSRPTGASPWIMIAPPGTKGGHGLDLAATVAAAASKPRTTAPAYLSQEYFNRLREVLEFSKQQGRKAVFYDEVGFPSGMANHTTPDALRRKTLRKTDESVTGPYEYRTTTADGGTLMAVVAMNTATRSRIDLGPLVRDGALTWQVPPGTWKVMVFRSVLTKAYGAGIDYNGAVDYLDPVAVQWFVDTVYEPHAREVGQYFGNTLDMTFFDDVGIFSDEKMWTGAFNARFKSRTGRDPAVYYPALWEDIGPESDAARVAFFDTRAELLADGFPKIVADWTAKHRMAGSGHPPGNYEVQPVDMNGDPFKYYRAQPVPLADVIFAYPYGRDGFKLIGDGADLHDKPVVAAETFGPFVPAGQIDGYRRAMELYVRGITKFVGAGPAPGAEKPAIGGPATYAEWAGRNSQMLQGGRRVSDIAILYPIADLQAFYRFDAPDKPKALRPGAFIPHHADYAAVGEMLLNEVHRDFTFLHPEILLSAKVRVNGRLLDLDNRVNRQSWRVLVLPGQKIISLKALEKIKAYYDGGGTLVATSLLPSKAAELAGSDQGALENDRKVQAIVQAIFGIDSTRPMPQGVSSVQRNAAKGQAVFISLPTGPVLGQTLETLGIAPDVRFDGNPIPSSGGGVFSYVHKEKEGRALYFFANSSNDAVDTVAEVRGRVQPELWDPMTGAVTRIPKVEYVEHGGQEYTRFPIHLKPVTATFVVSP